MELLKSTKNIIHYALVTLLLLLAFGAFGGGIFGMTGAKEVPLELLEGSPFHSYFIPGLFLFLVIGGSALFAAIHVIKRRSRAHKATLVCGIIVLLWLAIQVVIIGYASWMQPTTALMAIVILLLAMKLPKTNN